MPTPPPLEALAAHGRPVGDGGLLVQRGGLTLYVDPRALPPGCPPADLVLLSDGDPRAVSERDVLAVSGPSTIVAGLPPSVSRFRLNQLPILQGQSREALGVTLSILDDDGARARWRLRWPDLEAAHPAP
jgi:hypothetical protein